MSESPSLEELVDILATEGLDLPYEVAEAIAQAGEAAVPLLCDLILEETYLDREWQGSQGWGPVHALYGLAEIGSPRAVPALMKLIDHIPESDFVTEAWIVAVGCMGEAAIEPVLAYVRRDDGDAVLRGATATRALLEIGERWPALRQLVVDELSELIEDRALDDYLRSWMVQSAARVDDDGLQAAVDHAFEHDRIDTQVFDRVALDRTRALRLPGAPWAGGGAGREPMAHFERENLDSLRTIIEVLPASSEEEEGDDDSEGDLAGASEAASARLWPQGGGGAAAGEAAPRVRTAKPRDQSERNRRKSRRKRRRGSKGKSR